MDRASVTPVQTRIEVPDRSRQQPQILELGSCSQIHLWSSKSLILQFFNLTSTDSPSSLPQPKPLYRSQATNDKSMDIQTKDYTIEYDRATQTVTCCGSFRLSQMEEYAPIVDLLNEVADSSPNTITLDLRKLEFLNSSGISIVSKFALKVRQLKNIQIAVQGSKQIPWQGKSLKNLQRLMPSLHLELE